MGWRSGWIVGLASLACGPPVSDDDTGSMTLGEDGDPTDPNRLSCVLLLDERISHEAGVAFDIAVDPDGVHVVWHSDRFRLFHRDDAGAWRDATPDDALYEAITLAGSGRRPATMLRLGVDGTQDVWRFDGTAWARQWRTDGIHDVSYAPLALAPDGTAHVVVARAESFGQRSELVELPLGADMPTHVAHLHDDADPQIAVDDANGRHVWLSAHDARPTRLQRPDGSVADAFPESLDDLSPVTEGRLARALGCSHDRWRVVVEDETGRFAAQELGATHRDAGAHGSCPRHDGFDRTHLGETCPWHAEYVSRIQLVGGVASLVVFERAVEDGAWIWVCPSVEHGPPCAWDQAEVTVERSTWVGRLTPDGIESAALPFVRSPGAHALAGLAIDQDADGVLHVLVHEVAGATEHTRYLQVRCDAA